MWALLPHHRDQVYQNPAGSWRAQGRGKEILSPPSQQNNLEMAVTWGQAPRGALARFGDQAPPLAVNCLRVPFWHEKIINCLPDDDDGRTNRTRFPPAKQVTHFPMWVLSVELLIHHNNGGLFCPSLNIEALHH